MKEYKFYKMICSAGHSSKVYAANEQLPKRCPVCNQPYERKYNRPVYCLEDGTVPDEVQKLQISEKEQGGREEDPKTMITQAERSERDNQMKHSLPVSPVGMIHMRAGRRRETSQFAVRKGDMPKREKKNFSLFTGGRKIDISEEQVCLGRSAEGKEIFLMNLLISRKHADVWANDLGRLCVKDRGSLNGTYIDDGNGRRQLEQGEIGELKIGDRFWLANQILTIREEES